MDNRSNQAARIWIATVPYSKQPSISDRFDSDVTYSTGQREIGTTTGYEHWQFVIYFRKPQRLSALKKRFGDFGHYEPTRSAAADDYVRKEETRVAGTEFEYGRKPINRNSSTDWNKVVADAKSGQLDQIPSDILVRCYHNLKR